MNNRRNQSNDRNSQGGNNRGKGGNRGNASSKPSSGKGKPTFGGKPSEDGKKSFGPKKPFNKQGEKPFVKRLKKAPVDDGTIRLNKYVANAGIASRREADELIKTGIVTVNGQVITEMGYKVQPEDEVRFDGRKISSEKNVYFVLNKPKGFISTSKDEKDRKTVMDLMANATTARIFPVGRLDRQTTGVLLFTNDGYLTKKLTHPSHDIKKIYHVTLDKKLTANDLADIKKGVRLIPEGIAVVDAISFIEGRPKK